MTPSSFAFLHGGVGIGPSTYLTRVLLHLLAVGGIAVFTYSVSIAARTLRAAFTAD